MADKKDKTLSYRRATWFNENSKSIDLQSCIKEATTKLKSIDDRTIKRGDDKLVKLLKLSNDKNGALLLHLTIETPGEAASIVPSLKDVDNADVATTMPPEETEFMDGDAFLYVRDDDVCLCSTLVRDGAIKYFLYELFKKAKIRKDSNKFDLVKVADIDKVMLLHAQGVKEVVIKSTIYEATAQYARRKSQAAGILGSLSKNLKAFWGNENDVNQDSLHVLLEIKTDARRKGLKLGEERIEALAEDLLRNTEYNDDFVIITKEGQRIGPEEIYIRTKVGVKANGKSVDRDSAWKELSTFFNTLESIGATVQ
ncbi:hypothetical protein GGD81_003138 [Rhodobium orientis]|uniref:hypothetical protein n=1 Tax=Rhodobium orientis TaxID=34017 RepID=UPI0011B93CF0|nr:hypothetical protein [Rhodobium orientis]MBB4304083.1 hypothetical protein [Rhodobium orientis]